MLRLAALYLTICVLVLCAGSASVIAQHETGAAQQQDTGLTLVGSILDEVTKAPIVARLEFELQPSNILVAFDSSEGAGRFSIELPYLAKYHMRVTADNYFPITETIGFDRYLETRLIERDIRMKPLKPGAVIDLVGITFETGSAALTDASRPALSAVKQLLLDRPTMRVEISGHTDNVGDANENRALSLARAEAVVRYLVEAGIKHTRLVARGFGENKPVASNATLQGREVNRRVEFSIMD